MTPKQEYLARNMTDEDIEWCRKEAEKLERLNPWTLEDTARHANYTGYTCWLDLIMEDESRRIDYWRGMYCAEMEGLV